MSVSTKGLWFLWVIAAIRSGKPAIPKFSFIISIKLKIEMKILIYLLKNVVDSVYSFESDFVYIFCQKRAKSALLCSMSQRLHYKTWLIWNLSRIMPLNAFFLFVVMNTSNLKTSPQSDQRRRDIGLVAHHHERTRLVVASTSVIVHWCTHNLEENGPGEE